MNGQPLITLHQEGPPSVAALARCAHRPCHPPPAVKRPAREGLCGFTPRFRWQFLVVCSARPCRTAGMGQRSLISQFL